MFSAIFSTISIIEDRREGFLLSMMVSPAPRTSMVLGKILGSATLAWIQGLIFLAFAPLAGVRVGLLELIPIAAAIFLISFTLTGLGFVIAWKMDSTAGFHAHYEPAAGADVDGFRFALSHGDRTRLGEGHYVGQPADVFHFAVELTRCICRTRSPAPSPVWP